MATAEDRKAIGATESQMSELEQVEQLLEHLIHAPQARLPRLIGPNEEVLDLPEPVFEVLRQVVHYLSRGDSVTVVPVQKEVTTQEAADFLNVSRPYLVRLLKQGKMPFSMVGTHRRIRFDDLVQFKSRREQERRDKLTKLTQLNQDMGMYSNGSNECR